MIKHILVAIGANGSDAALKLAIERAREFNARLTAVHVVDRMPWWASGSIEIESTLEYIEAMALKIAEQAVDIMRDADIDGTCMTIDLPAQTTLSHVIARAARELDADLIVVGRSHGTNWRFWHEHVSDAVSRHSNRRVLIASDDAGRAETKATPLSYTIVDSTETSKI